MIMYVYISIYVYNTIQSYHMETNGKTMIESCFWYLDFIANLDYLVAVGRLSLGPSWLRIWPRNVEFQWVSPSFLWAKRVGSWGLHSSIDVEKWYGDQLGIFHGMVPFAESADLWNIQHWNELISILSLTGFREHGLPEAIYGFVFVSRWRIWRHSLFYVFLFV